MIFIIIGEPDEDLSVIEHVYEGSTTESEDVVSHTETTEEVDLSLQVILYIMPK